MYKKLVITKTPLRVSFLGGGTDLSNFYLKNSGLVVSSTIDKFIYVTIKQHGELFFRNYRLNYSKSENKNNLNLIQNDIIRETLKIIKINTPIYISSISDIPAHSGLGSSSAFTVGLIKALYEFKNMKISNINAAKLACEIEINRVKSPIGKQDQYATSIGGLNALYFKKNSDVIVQKLKKKKIINKIFDNSVFIWVGRPRKANTILKHQNSRIRKNLKNLYLIKDLAKILTNKIKKDKVTLNEIADLMNNNWSLKKNLSKKISSNNIHKIYNYALDCGSLGGKLLGAGGGGFLFLIVKKKEIKNFKKKMNHIFKKLKIMQFKHYENGSEILMSL